MEKVQYMSNQDNNADTRKVVISMDDVSYRYPRTQKWVLKHINLEVHEGEFLAIMGENGAGKTTLCQCMNSAVPNFHDGTLVGSVKVFGIDTKHCKMSDLCDKVGMVLDDPEAQLFTTSVRNEVAFGAENLCIEREEIIRRVDWALDIVSLSEFIDREPTALSGGQKQRLAIATNLAMMPAVLVLDEPTSQLDPVGTRDVYEVIRDLKEKEKMTIVIATHKSEEIAEFADRVLVLKNGEIAALDKPDVIFNDEELMKSCNIRPPQVSELASYLRDNGQDIGTRPTLMKEAREDILNWYRGA